MNLKRRLRALERQIQPPEEPLRVVLCHPGPPADLEQSECHRSILEDGRLMEVVQLNGSSEGISKEDLDRFAARFPIEPYQPRWGPPPSSLSRDSV
jgi:hypothetical protein